jgi:hypothetical protein
VQFQEKKTTNTRKLTKKDSFKDFLNASFSRTFNADNQVKKSSKVDPFDQSTVSLSAVKLEKDVEGPQRKRRPSKVDPNNDTIIDCIDLRLSKSAVDADHMYENATTFRSSSPSLSIRTTSEFGEPDHRGQAKRIKSGAATGQSSSLIGKMETMIGSVFGTGNGVAVRGASSRASTLPEDDADYCHHCGSSGKPQKYKRMSCWTLLFLLAVDAFTVGLLIILFSQVNHHLPGIPHAQLITACRTQ